MTTAHTDGVNMFDRTLTVTSGLIGFALGAYLAWALTTSVSHTF